MYRWPGRNGSFTEDPRAVRVQTLSEATPSPTLRSTGRSSEVDITGFEVKVGPGVCWLQLTAWTFPLPYSTCMFGSKPASFGSRESELSGDFFQNKTSPSGGPQRVSATMTGVMTANRAANASVAAPPATRPSSE